MPNRVKEERDKREMTQQDLAVAAGVHVSLVSRIERGKGCEVKTAQKLAAALDTTVDELFSAADDELAETTAA